MGGMGTFEKLIMHQINLGDFENKEKWKLELKRIEEQEEQERIERLRVNRAKRANANKLGVGANSPRYKINNNKEIYELLGVKSSIVKNLRDPLMHIYTFVNYISNNCGLPLNDPILIHKLLTDQSKEYVGAEFKVIDKLKKGYITSDVVALDLLSVIFRLTEVSSPIIELSLSNNSMLAVIGESPDSSRILIIKFRYNQEKTGDEGSEGKPLKKSPKLLVEIKEA